MLDSIEIQTGDKNNLNSSAAINQLKQGLKEESSMKNNIQENQNSTKEVNPQSPMNKEHQ